MDNKTIATKLTEGIEKRVSECHGWCDIKKLSGELHEGLFMATFADDSRIVFEDDQNGFLHVLLTKYQTEGWGELHDEERIQTLEEILVFYHRHMTDMGESIIGAANRKKFEVTLNLTIDLVDCEQPSCWDWSTLLGLPEADVALIKCKEVGNEV